MKSLLLISVLFAPLLATCEPQLGKSVNQSTEPLPLEAARDVCPIRLPPNARNIQYATYSEWNNYQCFVRFEAPVDECVQSIEDIFRSHAEKMKWKHTPPTLRRIEGPQTVDVTPAAQMDVDWFDISEFKRGLTAGELNSWQPQVWVDTDRGVLYYCLTD